MKNIVVGVLLLAAGGVGLWGFSAAWGEPLGLAYAIPLFLLAAWSIADAVNSSVQRPSVQRPPPRPIVGETRRRTGLTAWFVISCAVGVIIGIALTALVIAALLWEWVPGRLGGVMAPLGVALAAAIASAGAARTLKAQSLLNEQTQLEDAERLLWARFDKASEQLAHEHYAIRAAGVYSLAGLADDWIRHNERSQARKGIRARAQRRSVTLECGIIVDILCAYMRTNRHLDQNLDQRQRGEEKVVQEAIMTQIASHAQLNRNATDPCPERIGLWAARDHPDAVCMDLRFADLPTVRWPRVDLKNAMLKRAYLYDADLKGANLSGANLFGADLRRTELEGSALDGANLEEIKYDPNHQHWPDNFQLPSSARPDTTEGRRWEEDPSPINAARNNRR